MILMWLIKLATGCLEACDLPAPVDPCSGSSVRLAMMRRTCRRSSFTIPGDPTNRPRHSCEHRRTMVSPSMVGIDETRTLTSFFSILSVKRPSCGSRMTVMSMLARIFILAMMGSNRPFGGEGTSWSFPSIRKRTWTLFCWGLIWISLAPSRIACAKIEFTRRMTGASPARLKGRDLNFSGASRLVVPPAGCRIDALIRLPDRIASRKCR